MEDPKRLKVLFLASWYPSRLHPVNGIFIQKHAEAVAKCCDVAALFVGCDPNLTDSPYEIESGYERDVFTVRVYYRPTRLRIRGLAWLGNQLHYMRAAGLGRKTVLKAWGRIDVLHVNVAHNAGFLALLWKSLYGTQYLLTEHCSLYTDEDGSYHRMPPLLRALTRRVFHNACAVTAVSTYLMEALQRCGLAPKGRTYVVPNVVDVPWRGAPCPKEDGEIHILTVALLSDKAKNLSGLLRTFARMVERNPRVRLHIVGDGADRPRLEALAAELDLLPAQVSFHGYVPNHRLDAYFNQAHFFVLNSHYETFSVATVEALIHGVPVVVTRCGGPESFVTTEVGILVERNNEASLLEGMESMAAHWRQYDPAFLHHYACGRFGSEAVGAALAALYRQALPQRRQQP
jgi:glycosyltransferase involved in cell wall biosynthesis